jgi:hypothetical protein
VPGGPWNKTPRGGVILKRWKISGYSSGKETISFSIDQLKEMVSLPLLYPEIFQRFKITPPRGVLFHGPPENTARRSNFETLEDFRVQQRQRNHFFQLVNVPLQGKYNNKQALADADPLGVDMNVNFDHVGGLQGHIDPCRPSSEQDQPTGCV